MPLGNQPQGWGNDEISKFIDAARGNEYATFANFHADLAPLTNIDQVYRKAISGLDHAKEWFAGLFLLRAHSNLLAACRLSWSGQIPETYAVLRSCLENGLYGLYLANNPASQETWLRRHDSIEAKKKVRDEFRIAALLALADAAGEDIGNAARMLYERTIDWGAHPNEHALLQSLAMREHPTHVEFNMAYLEGNPDQYRLALRTTVQVGLCTLFLFRAIYPERFAILGITDALHQMKKDL